MNQYRVIVTCLRRRDNKQVKTTMIIIATDKRHAMAIGYKTVENIIKKTWKIGKVEAEIVKFDNLITY